MGKSMSLIVAEVFCGDGIYHSAQDIISAYMDATGCKIDRVQAKGIKKNIINAKTYDTETMHVNGEKLIKVNLIHKQKIKLSDRMILINSIFR